MYCTINMYAFLCCIFLKSLVIRCFFIPSFYISKYYEKIFCKNNGRNIPSFCQEMQKRQKKEADVKKCVSQNKGGQNVL